MGRLGRVLVLLSAVILAASMEKSDMYMENSGSEDMEMSASGYAYQTHTGEPSFAYSNSNDDSSSARKFQYPPLGYGHYKYQQLPLRSIPLSTKYVPMHYDRLLNSYGLPLTYAAYAEPVKGYEALMEPIKTGTPEAVAYGLDSTYFLKGGGSSYDEAEKASRGEKGERAYLNREEYEKGSKGENENEQHKGYYNKVGGNKAGYQEIAGHYGNKEQASKAGLGGSFSDKTGQDKGSKTTGYHKVYHKDDYKKDHSFYDRADRRGHFKKYGDYDAKHAAQQGDFEKGGHRDAGFKGRAYGIKDVSDKNRFVDESRGYKGAAGRQKYYQNSAQYADKAGKEANRESGKKQAFRLGDNYRDIGQLSTY